MLCCLRTPCLRAPYAWRWAAPGKPRRIAAPVHRAAKSKTPPQQAGAATATTSAQLQPSPAPLLTAPQALFLGALASCATMMSVYRNALQALLIPALPLAARLPAWVVRAAMPLVGLCAYPGVLLCAAAGAAAAASWALWGLVECMMPGAPPVVPHPELAEETNMASLKFRLYKAQQEASDAKYALAQLERRQEQANMLTRQLEERAAEARMARVEAAGAREELARAQREAQDVSTILSSTLDSLSMDSDGPDESGYEAGSESDSWWEAGATGGSSGSGGLAAAADMLRSKVASLQLRATLAALHREEVRGLEEQARASATIIAELNRELTLLRQQAMETQLAMRAMEQEVGGLQEENRGLQAVAEKAERHLNAYDKMVLALEAQLETLQGPGAAQALGDVGLDAMLAS